MPARSPWRTWAAALAVGMLAPVLAVAAPAIAPAHAAGATAAFSPVDPVRLLDTRATTGAVPTAGTTLTIPVRTVKGVPSDAVAVTVTVTATQSTGAGFVTLWGDGPRPSTSALNIDAANETRGNFAIVPVGADGSIRAFLQTGAHVVVDLTGVFRPASTATAGRFVPVGPTRAVDTRSSHNPLVPGELRPISLTKAGVPADATAVAVSLTGIGGAGWWSAFPPNTPWPGTATVSVPADGVPATGTAVVKAANGAITVSAMSGGDLVIDVLGYFTGAGAASSTEGLFVPSAPTRVLDTRGAPGPVGVLVGDTSIAPTSYPFTLASTAAVAANVTAVEPTGPGFLTAYPASTARPNASLANVTAGQLLATGSLVPTSSIGFSVYSMVTTHVVVDVTGWFLGKPQPAAPPPAPYALLFKNSNGVIWKWDPCITIPVYVNPAGAPAYAIADLTSALAQLDAASGLHFTLAGTTDGHAPTATAASPSVIVHWMTAKQDPGLSGTTLGWGGAQGVSSGGTYRLYSGEVRLKAGVDYMAWGGDALLDLLLHELGHVAGLAHITDPGQIMYPDLARLFGRYQAGDLAGLAVVGGSCPG